MKNKNYLRDKNGMVRNCSANIAKMNPFEYMVLKVNNKSFWKNTMLDLSEQYREGLENFGWGIVNTLLLITFPISLTIAGIFEIKRARKEVEEYRKRVKATRS